MFVTGAKGVGGSVEAELAERVLRATAGWRGVEDYLALGGSGALAAGFGLLLRAPEPIAAMAAEIVQERGAVASVISEHRSGGQLTDPSRYQVMLLGRNFVIASAFRFVRQ